MKPTLNSVGKLGIFAATILLAAGAFAASKGSMELYGPATVAGKQLAAGQYTLQWEGTGDQVTLNILQNKKQVVSTPAHIVKLDHPLPQSAVMLQNNSDGSRAISRIAFSRKDFALELDNGGGAAGTAGAAK